MITKRWLYLLMLIPTLSELLETGRLPSSPRSLITDVVLTIVVGVLVCYIRREHLEVIRLSQSDPLSGLYNRRRFQDDLSREITRAQRMGTSLVLAYIDIDRFKSINDRHGHDEGDRILKRMGKLLEDSTRRDVDTCYRIGGDEFVILLPAMDSKGAEGVLKRVSCLGSRASEFLECYGAGLSIGIAELIDGETPEVFLQRADRMMYAEKEKG